MDILREKFRDVSVSVIPIVIIVLLLTFFIVPVESVLLYRFIIGAIIIIIGLAIFLFGADLGIRAIGELMGGYVAKSNKISIVAVMGFLLGFLITVAEPDLMILANQVEQASGGMINRYSILLVVSTGVGIMVAIGFFRILYDFKMSRLFTILYALIIMLSIFVSEEFLAIAFDSSGATTGAMTTPFFLALALGVSRLKGSDKAEEDSFGMVGIASAGPIFGVMLMSIISGVSKIQGEAELVVQKEGVLAPFIAEIFPVARDGFMAVMPLLILFVVFNILFLKVQKKEVRKIYFGVLYTFLGLVIFLIGVNAGFMDLARELGRAVAEKSGVLLVVLGFLFGMVVVLAEPAVYVLSKQVEEVTAGSIPRKILLITLSIGVACAVGLSMVRILFPAVKLWMFIIPGFIISVILSYKVPPIFVGIAFDSGGVASGPMTATFILAMSQGAAEMIPTANVMVDGFGVIAMVAMTPVLAIHILGIIFQRRSMKGGNNDK